MANTIYETDDQQSSITLFRSLIASLPFEQLNEAQLYNIRFYKIPNSYTEAKNAEYQLNNERENNDIT